MSGDEKTFGQTLRDLRRGRLTQRKLAERVGVDFSYISKLENDRLPAPSAETIERMCDELGVPPDELLALAGKVPRDLGRTLAKSVRALEFLREVSEMRLSEEEWVQLRRGLRRLRED